MNRLEDLFTEDDFQGHPDENALEVDPRDYPGVKVVLEERSGRGYALPDGLWVFPGDDCITEIITH